MRLYFKTYPHNAWSWLIIFIPPFLLLVERAQIQVVFRAFEDRLFGGIPSVDLSDSMQVNYCYFVVPWQGEYLISLLNCSQKLTDDYTKKIDVMFKQKEKVSLLRLLEYFFDLNESLLHSNNLLFPVLHTYIPKNQETSSNQFIKQKRWSSA